MKNNILSIIVPTHNRAEEVIGLYKKLKSQTFNDFDFFVINDVCDKDQVDILEGIHDENYYIFSIPPPHKFQGDLNFINTLKFIITKKNPKYIYHFHDDMKINDVNLLETVVEYMESHENCGAVGATIYNGDGVMTWGPGIKKIRMGKEYILNESFLVRTRCYLEMGLIPESLKFYGTEYFIFNWLRENNYLTHIMPDVSITHFAGQIDPRGGSSTNYQNHKDYFRPRTTILIMKLFLQNDSFLTKLKYFYYELSEPRLKLKKYFKKCAFFKLIKTLIILTYGTLIGIITPIKINPPYKP